MKYQRGRGARATGFPDARLHPECLVDQTVSFAGNFLNAGTGFIGFKFDGGAGTRYGWARVTMDGAPSNSYTLVDFAYGDVGDSILTGQVPEPGGLGLLALGAAGVALRRRSRARRVEAS